MTAEVRTGADAASTTAEAASTTAGRADHHRGGVMTATMPAHPRLAGLTAEAAATGLTVRSTGGWPESTVDTELPGLPGFVVSTFSPLVAQAAERCLQRAGALAGRTGIVLLSPLGDVTSAVHLAQAVDTGGRIGPLLFFQSVPNAVAGYLAARWGLTGPVACLGQADGGLDLAALLIADGSADEVLVVLAEQSDVDGVPDRGVALLVRAGSPADGGAEHSEGVTR